MASFSAHWPAHHRGDVSSWIELEDRELLDAFQASSRGASQSMMRDNSATAPAALPAIYPGEKRTKMARKITFCLIVLFTAASVTCYVIYDFYPDEKWLTGLAIFFLSLHIAMVLLAVVLLIVNCNASDIPLILGLVDELTYLKMGIRDRRRAKRARSVQAGLDEEFPPPVQVQAPGEAHLRR
ncbi:uncharacterized protein F4822DRAFT_390839 [Hypoxylon trugodes]|uniref:uncharacterized protein n=1 Tax=Hypoxylon trugodes TaxID=326681 RepID=UPI00219D9C33|nr:uncharacterized protein F4822DRAFT_390839 [Hypoxylon trugodes]KAI1392380.1 hypothetical protein F4822DRAFT_390839 [Hypoxylon trugodes]